MADSSSWPRVGCGVAIVDGGKLLLVKRRREPEAGFWGLPGGKVDPYETLTDAAAREIREELGIVVKPIDLLCLVEQLDRDAGHHWVAPVYRVDTYLETPTIREPEALADMGWFELDHLPHPVTFATDRAVSALQYASAARP